MWMNIYNKPETDYWNVNERLGSMNTWTLTLEIDWDAETVKKSLEAISWAVSDWSVKKVIINFHQERQSK